jgi:sulfonate transport system substrate-binding protein
MAADGAGLDRRTLILATACLAPGACAPPRASGAVLNVASQKGNTRAVVEASGALKGAGYAVSWSEFGAAAPLLEALGAGAVDVGGVGDAPFVFAYAAGSKIKAITALQAAASGASTAVIVPNASPIRTIEDLKGRRVATGKGSVGQYLLLRLLERAELPFDAVQTVFLSPGDGKAALQRGAVDAWSTWAPYIGLATLHDANRVLADGRGLFTGYSFMAATDTAIAAKRGLLQDFVTRLTAAYRWAAANPALYAAALAHDTGLPVDVEADLVRRQGIRLVRITADVARAEASTLDLFRRAGIASIRSDIDAAFDPSFSAAPT